MLWCDHLTDVGVVVVVARELDANANVISRRCHRCPLPSLLLTSTSLSPQLLPSPPPVVADDGHGVRVLLLHFLLLLLLLHSNVIDGDVAAAGAAAADAVAATADDASSSGHCPAGQRDAVSVSRAAAECPHTHW